MLRHLPRSNLCQNTGFWPKAATKMGFHRIQSFLLFQYFNTYLLDPMKRRLFLIIILTLGVSVTMFGQPAQTVSVIHDIHRINSQILGEERTILVRVPAAYRQPDTRFPVIYMLDAHPPQNAMMAGLIEQQAWGGVIPEMIVVGIQNTNRTRDLTPTKTERAGTGGGDKFLDFIEKEVIPLVEKSYRTQPYRIFAGHSLGGLTAVYALASRPGLFNAYIAASPVLHWDDNFPIKHTEEALKQNKDWNVVLFASIGDEPDYVKGFNSYQALLKKANPKKFEYEFQVFKNDNHGSVVLPTYYAGLRKIYDGWAPPASIAIADLEAHYQKISRRYGYNIPVPEEIQNRAGYTLLQANRIDEALIFFKKNVENFPNSSNVYDSLGEAYEKNGQFKQAAQNYEKAYKLAESRGETQLAQTYKTNFERVGQKIK